MARPRATFGLPIGHLALEHHTPEPKLKLNLLLGTAMVPWVDQRGFSRSLHTSVIVNVFGRWPVTRTKPTPRSAGRRSKTSNERNRGMGAEAGPQTRSLWGFEGGARRDDGAARWQRSGPRDRRWGRSGVGRSWLGGDLCDRAGGTTGNVDH
jgi:hypothetical protein